MSKMMKRISIGMLAFCLGIIGFSLQSAQSAKASAEIDSEKGVIWSYLDVAEYRENREQKDFIAPECEESGYIFAGWYTEEGSTTPIKKDKKTGDAWAKFVPEEILTVKTQILANVLDGDASNDNTTSIRFVTTVDSLYYDEIGFDFVIKGTSAPRSDSKVYDKLYAIGETDGKPIEYKPQVFSPSSRYFKTWTFINVTKGDYDKDIQATPFWVTLDGTKVSGAGDTKTVQQGIDSYFTEADTSWYDKNEDFFVIYTPQQLRGFVELVKEDDFAGKTVQLGEDIVLNVGDAKDWATTPAKYPWATIGSEVEERGKPFAGTFDGKGHTISGLYIQTSNGYTGLFGATGLNSEIKNLSLTNSYLESTNKGNALIGSIAGKGMGNFTNIYSDAIVVSKGSLNGGLVGQLQHGSLNDGGKCVISNCQFDGEIIAAGQWTGGITGRSIHVSETTIEHCLFTGTASSTYTYEGAVENGGAALGGIIGSCYNGTITIKDTLSTGLVKEAPKANETGSVIGWNNSAAKTVVDNSYASKDTAAKEKGSGNGVKDGTGASLLNYGYSYATADMTGVKALQNEKLKLDFDKYWTVPIGRTPVLKSFYKAEDGVQADLTWYIGKGSPYSIATKEQLYSFAELVQEDGFAGKTVCLDKDITVNEGDATTWGEKAPVYAWTPIGGNNDTRGKRFTGTFDGQGYTISGLYTSGTTMIGLFAVTDTGANVKDLSLVNSYFKSTTSGAVNIAGIVGAAYDGNFEKIYCDATVVAKEGTQAGGIIAYVCQNGQDTRKTSVSDCWFAGTVDAVEYIGGIVGYSLNSGGVSISHCLNTGSVTGTGTPSRAGGILGCIRRSNATAESNIVIEDCLNLGKVQGGNTSCTGSVIGQLYGGNSTVTITNTATSNESYMKNNAACTVGNVGDGSTVGGEAKAVPEAELIGVTACEKTPLDFAGHWMAVTDSTPVLRSFYTPENGMGIDISWYDGKGTYIITEAEQLFGLSYLSQSKNFKDETFKLDKNIVINEGDASAWKEAAPAHVWTPIGNNTGTTNRFQGTFDGQGHSISGLYASGSQLIGVFAVTDAGADVKNLSVLNSYFEAVNEEATTVSIGGIVGQAYDGKFTNIYCEAEIVATNGRQAGGIMGYAYHNNNTARKVTLSNCWFAGSVDAYGYIGGMIGYIYNSKDVTIAHCLNTGRLTGAEEPSRAGGIVGAIRYSNTAVGTSSVIIEDCLNVGKIQGGNQYCTGSIIGQIFDANCTVTVTNVYASNESFMRGTTAYPVGANTSGGVVKGEVATVPEADLMGDAAKTNATELSWDIFWETSETTPVLKWKGMAPQ